MGWRMKESEHMLFHCTTTDPLSRLLFHHPQDGTRSSIKCRFFRWCSNGFPWRLNKELKVDWIIEEVPMKLWSRQSGIEKFCHPKIKSCCLATFLQLSTVVVFFLFWQPAHVISLFRAAFFFFLFSVVVGGAEGWLGDDDFGFVNFTLTHTWTWKMGWDLK